MTNNSSIYVDECCLSGYMNNQRESGDMAYIRTMVEIPLKEKTHVLPVDIELEGDGQAIGTEILKKVRENYGV